VVERDREMPASMRCTRIVSLPMTSDLGMDLPRFLALIRARAKLIAAIVAGAFLVTLAVSLLLPSRYEASAGLLFGRSSAADAIIAGRSIDSGEVPERTTATNLELATLDTVARRVAREIAGSQSANALKSAVSVDPQGDSDLAKVTARWDRAEGAADVANAFADQIVAVRRETARTEIQDAIDALNDTLAAQAPPAEEGAAPAPETAATRALRDRISELETLKALETGGVRVVERATPPEASSSPKPLRNALIAAFIAVALAPFLVLLLARLDERVGDEDELAELLDAPVLARIPRVRARRLLPANSPYQHPSFLEAFEFLRLNLQLMEPERGSVVLAVTSPAEGDGKTTVVSWLARSLALGGGEVTAVDLDVRKPELHDYLNAPEQAENGAAPREPEPEPETYAAPREPEPDTYAGPSQPGARRGYTAEDIRAGLGELVRAEGNVRRAALALKAAGRDISETTLRRWKVYHAPLYAELGATTTVPVGARRETRDGGAAPLTRPTLNPHLRLMSGSSLPALPIVRGRLQELFDQLRRDADYVLVDTVPVSTLADASAVASAADGVILVVDLQRTRRRDIVAAKKQLRNARTDLRGIVLNRAAVERPPYAQDDFDDPLADQPRH